MLATERHQKILTLIEERGTVRTIDLAEEFQVTDETIRRDFQTLAEDELLTRIHGGASSLSGRPRLRSFNERSDLNTESKQAIARAAVELTQPGRTYAFDSSTTAVSLVHNLPDIPFRIVTNALAVIDRISTTKEIELISTGGRFDPKTNTFVGGDSINTLRRHHIHTAFISCIGFDLERGASEGYEQQATFKERLVQLSEEVILLIDSTKFAESSEYYFAEPNRITRVITDKAIDPEFAAQIRNKGIKLTIAE